MSHPYRETSTRVDADERGPRWGVTWWVKLWVRFFARFDPALVRALEEKREWILYRAALRQHRAELAAWSDGCVHAALVGKRAPPRPVTPSPPPKRIYE